MTTSTKITENVVATVSKGPLIIFVIFGLGFWQLSKMTDEQIKTIETLIRVLNNLVGVFIAGFLLLILVYALVLYPLGKFAASFARELIDLQKAHNEQNEKHVESSKQMFHMLEDVNKAIGAMNEKLDKFFSGHD